MCAHSSSTWEEIQSQYLPRQSILFTVDFANTETLLLFETIFHILNADAKWLSTNQYQVF